MLGIVRLQLVVVLLAAVARRPSRVADEDARSSVETILQIVADDAEERQSHPAGSHRTGAAHSVTFALLSHLRRNVLQIEMNKMIAVSYFILSNRLAFKHNNLFMMFRPIVLTDGIRDN